MRRLRECCLAAAEMLLRCASSPLSHISSHDDCRRFRLPFRYHAFQPRHAAAASSSHTPFSRRRLFFTIFSAWHLPPLPKAAIELEASAAQQISAFADNTPPLPFRQQPTKSLAIFASSPVDTLSRFRHRPLFCRFSSCFHAASFIISLSSAYAALSASSLPSFRRQASSPDFSRDICRLRLQKPPADAASSLFRVI